MSEDLELTVQVTKPDGRVYGWDAHGDAEDIPTGITCTTKRMEGFSSASLSLPRRIDQDHPDIELRDDLTILSATGDTVWEGRVTAAPRSLDDGHSIDVQATGHIAALKDRKFVQVYVDRNGSNWEAPKGDRQRQLAAQNDPLGLQYTASANAGGIGFNGTAGTGNLIVAGSTAEMVYTMPDGILIASLGYKGTQANTSNVDAAAFITCDLASFASGTGSVALTLDDTSRTATVTTPAKYGTLSVRATVNHTPPDTAPHSRIFSQLAVYGDHGVTLRENSGEPYGVYASDVMAHVIENYCTGLTWAGNDTTYPISQLAFRDLTYPYDALLACNAFHLLDLACWEDRTVTWRPIDLSDWDWEVRLDDEGFKVTLEGDADDDSGYNGIVIQYTDLGTGEPKILWPDEHDELTDTDELNPANRHGTNHWADETLSNPCLEADALQLGRALLAEKNQPKSPGNYTIGGGYVRNRQGVWQPSWKVRAGDRVVIVDHPNRRPRLITETSYSADSKTLTLATDSAIQRIDGYFDRLRNSLDANGLQ